MARGKTFKFGKMLVNVSGRGIATKDTTTGDIKRHAFPWASAPRPTEPEPQDSDYEEADEAQEYPEDAAYYADDEDQAYGEEAYDDADEPEEDYDEDEEREKPAGILGATWFMWLMLIVLPPLGIWLLWRNNRYEITPRSAISAAAVVWFIVLLIWLFSHIGGRDTTVANLPSASPSPDPTVEVQVTPEPVVTPNVNPTEAAANSNNGTLPGSTEDVSAGPTPNTAGTAVAATATPDPNASASPDGTGASPSQAMFVYSTASGQYYHSYATCSNMVNPDRVTLSVALSRKQTACPYCWTTPSATTGPTATPLPAGMYYYRPDGTYYHLDSSCQGMKNAQAVSEADAIAAGKTACPVCIGSVYITSGGTWYHANSTCQGMKNAKKVTIAEAREAGKTECPICMNGTPTEGTPVTTSDVYYTTGGGTWYHSDATCQGMNNAYRISAAAAEQAGKRPCPKCLNSNSGVANYYATSGGQYYHTDRTCSGMANAARVSLATAISRGQTACPKCAGGKETSARPTTVTVDTENAGAANNNTRVSDSTYYATSDGTYYHRDATCSGMKGATVVSAAQIAARGQQPCPKCIGTSGVYYSTTTGTYYHSNPTCSGMTGANIVTLAMIRSRGQSACPKCIGNGGNATTTSVNAGEPNGNYFATASGRYYHATADCSGMTNAVRVTRATAESRGQKPCPTCLGSVYSGGGQWYHNDPNCQGMTGAKLTTIAAAKQAGQTACPVCIGGGTAPAAPAETPKPVDTPSEENNLSYYATASGQYYHRSATCSGMTGANRVSEASAVARGQKPCPVCIGTVYTTDGGDYYHAVADCSGMKGAKLMTVDQAELSGKSPCPACMGGKSTTDNNGNNGSGQPVTTSDGNTEVWVSVENARYHASMNCSNLQYPVKTRLEQAVKQGYTRCPTCNAPIFTTST